MALLDKLVPQEGDTAVVSTLVCPTGFHFVANASHSRAPVSWLPDKASAPQAGAGRGKQWDAASPGSAAEVRLPAGVDLHSVLVLVAVLAILLAVGLPAASLLMLLLRRHGPAQVISAGGKGVGVALTPPALAAATAAVSDGMLGSQGQTPLLGSRGGRRRGRNKGGAAGMLAAAQASEGAQQQQQQLSSGASSSSSVSLTSAGGMLGHSHKGNGGARSRYEQLQPDGALVIGRLRVGPGILGYGSAGNGCVSHSSTSAAAAAAAAA